MSEVLVWTGTHANEKRSLDVGYSLRTDPLPNVKTELANVEAYRLNQRFVDLNLMMAFPGHPQSTLYEGRRASQIIDMSRRYDYIIDLHSNPAFGDTTAFIDKTRGIPPRLLSFLGKLGIENLILSEGMGVFSHVDNGIGLELGYDLSIDHLRNEIGMLADDSQAIPEHTVDDFAWFEYLTSIHETHLHPSDMSVERFDSLEPFMELPELTAILGRKACLMEWSRELKYQGYWGELVTPIDSPDISEWPAQ